jgi:hypothetical protein
MSTELKFSIWPINVLIRGKSDLVRGRAQPGGSDELVKKSPKICIAQTFFAKINTYIIYTLVKSIQKFLQIFRICQKLTTAQ